MSVYTWCYEKEKEKERVTDCIAGHFSLACGENNVVLWESKKSVAVCTLSIFLAESCGEGVTVQVLSKKGAVDSFIVTPNNTRSRTFIDVKEISVSCDPGLQSSFCYGRYCCDLHYFI
ncbi:S-Ena type endospore appendage [Sutcliffiella deserti]|uniref:S-Ena type endospore appendage n=1 Tax=Sutcliffiella deserti TaxID=2875501 RepID=UPI001CBBCFBB|nr:S-Ena type endospore appendage [Sutcliffiella deserti]